MEKERQQRKQKMSQLLARVKLPPANSATVSPPTALQPTTSATTPTSATPASSPASPRLTGNRGKRRAAHARASSANLTTHIASSATTADQRAPSVSLSTTATSTFVLAMQKREQEAEQRKQAAALRRKQKDDEAKAALQHKQLQLQQRKQDDMQSAATKHEEEQGRLRAVENEKQRQRELQREKVVLACMHHSYALMRWTGWEGWRRYVRARREREQKTAERGEQKRVRRLWRVWKGRVEQRRADEAREEERKMTKAANHYHKQLQSNAFQPWQRLTSQHTRSVQHGDAHYQQSVRRTAYLLWLYRMRAVVTANEERLRVLEVRAVAMGERHVLRFWLIKWKHAHTLVREEKQMSADLVTLSHTHDIDCVPTVAFAHFFFADSLCCSALFVRSDELKEETWKKVNGWLSSYRAQKKTTDII